MIIGRKWKIICRPLYIKNNWFWPKRTKFDWNWVKNTQKQPILTKNDEKTLFLVKIDVKKVHFMGVIRQKYLDFETKKTEKQPIWTNFDQIWDKNALIWSKIDEKDWKTTNFNAIWSKINWICWCNINKKQPISTKKKAIWKKKKEISPKINLIGGIFFADKYCLQCSAYAVESSKLEILSLYT